jgi:hypothetical protein
LAPATFAEAAHHLEHDPDHHAEHDPAVNQGVTR